METVPAYDKILDGYSFSVVFNCISRDYDEDVAIAKALTDYLDGSNGTAGSVTCKQAYLEGGSVDTEYDVYEKPYFNVSREFTIDLCQ